MKQDTNFDQLAPRFQRNIYDSAKGKIRLAVLQRDFDEVFSGQLDLKQTKILDAGAGQGQFALQLAQKGAKLTLCDISEEMLSVAKSAFAQAQLPEGSFAIEHCALQDIANRHSGPYDLILCHAVAEWLANPEDVFACLLPLLNEGGYFSFIFYNFYGLEFKNLLRTNFKYFDRNAFSPRRGSLTPINPLTPEQIIEISLRYKLDLKMQSGIRVIHDYIMNKQDREREPDTLLAKELAYSRLEPYWRLGRYIHFIFQK